MGLGADSLVPIIIAISFAAGLNVYATVAVLGLLSRFGALALPSSLHLLASNTVIGLSIFLFAIELVADKIPYFDLLWNSLHTLIRVPVAALIAYEATAHLSPATQVGATALGAAIALAAHGGKTAARAAVAVSPEPFSNIGLSMGEDALAVFLTWFAAHHPIAAAGIVVLLLVTVAAFARFVIRSLAALLRGASREWSG